MFESSLFLTASQLTSSYAGCEGDYSYCAPSDFLSSDQAGSTPFTDPAGRNPIYQGEAPVYPATAPHSQMLYPDCDPMPGWQVNWNPPDCSGQYPPPDVRGLMPPAAWAHAPHDHMEALAAPVAVAEAKTAKASPGHLALCGNAALLGAASATSTLLEELLSNGTDAGESFARWNVNFKEATMSAASAVSPVGGAVLRDRVFQ